MIVGDVVSQSVIRVDRPNVKATFKPGTGKVAMLLLLGDADKKDPDSFNSVKAMNDLGWVQAPYYEEMKELVLEIWKAPSSSDLSKFQTSLQELAAKLLSSPT